QAHNTKAHGEVTSPSVACRRHLRPCASGCGNPRNGAVVSMAGVHVIPTGAPGCQVDHTPE
ncbi:TPA: hypothetical protein ACH7AF_005197, partial [Escherichia coli]